MNGSNLIHLIKEVVVAKVDDGYDGQMVELRVGWNDDEIKGWRRRSSGVEAF